MRTFLQAHLLPMVILQSVLLYAIAPQIGVASELAVLVGSLIALGTAFLAERIWPYRATWRETGAELRSDLCSAAVAIGAVDPLLKLSLPLVVVALYPSAPSNWPLLAEVVAVTLLIEFGKYLSHLAHHRFGLLWCLHAMHHSPEKLNTWNNFRIHPLNYLINGLAVLPALLIGASSEAVIAYLAFTQPVLMLQHANADLRHGFWNWVFSTNQLHRWHHAADEHDGHANYGNALILWDQIFGTWRTPGEVGALGLFAASRRKYPATAGYWRQLISCRLCCASG